VFEPLIPSAAALRVMTTCGSMGRRSASKPPAAGRRWLQGGHDENLNGCRTLATFKGQGAVSIDAWCAL
jgi:hypothetical protein